MKNKLVKKITNFKLLLSILLLFAATISSSHAFSFRNMTLDFVQISDTHISTDREDTPYKALSSSQVLLKDAIEQINEIKGLDFVLFTGDLVDSATIENYTAYYQLLTKLKYPSLNAFGNHDFYNADKEQVLKVVKHYNPNYIFDNTYYAITPKTDYRIIVLDATMQNITTSNGELSEEQLAFLDYELSKNQDKIVLIAIHHPSVQPFIAAEHAMLNATQMNEVLVKYKNPIVVVSGHYHAAKIRTAGNIMFISTPALVTYPMAFRHIKITNYKDRVKYEFDFIPTRLEEIKEKNRQSVISYSMLAGSEKDRNYSAIISKKHPKSAKYKINKIESFAKEAKVKDYKQPKEKQPKQIKEPTLKQSNKTKPIRESKPKQAKESKENKELKVNSFKESKFLNIFKRTKNATQEDIQEEI